MLQQSGVIEGMAGELGIDPQTAKIGAGALLPTIVAGTGCLALTFSY
jgi:phage shock protein PspC (stress-responsive transcriptional regulator)